MATNKFTGKTLKEIAETAPIGFFNGYSIFRVLDEIDDVGVPVDENVSVGLILKKHPELANAVVVHTNDFYGTTVLRVLDKEVTEAPVVVTKTTKEVAQKVVPETCDNCAHNSVCDHNKFGFENCGHFLRHFD